MPRIVHRISSSALLLCALLAGGLPAQEAHAACQCTRTAGVASCCDWNCQFLPADAVCRPSLGPCDVPDTCSGTSAACPDGYAPAGTTCSASPPATCSGTSLDCLTGSGEHVGQPTYCAAPELRVPEGLTATAGNAQVALSWSPVLGSARYNVKRGINANSLSIVASPTSNSFTDYGVNNLTTYYYAVSAINGQAGIESNNSATVSATPAVLPAPANLLALAGDSRAALSWEAVAGASGYRVVRNGTTTLNAGAVTAYTDSPLINGVTYSYYVYASPASGGEGAHSNTATATPVGPPARPSSVSATASGTQVSLAWAASPSATSYNVLRSTVSGSGYAAVATGITGTTYSNTGLATATTYYYVVQGANFYGTGAPSAEAQATTVPAAPTEVVGVGGSGQITVSWAAAPKATSYNLLRSTTSGSGYVAFTGSTGLTGTSYVNSGLAAGSTHYYVVEAANAAGTSARSAQVAATTAPAAPTGLAWSSPSTTQINISWAAVTGATSYNLKRAGVSGGPHSTIATIINPTAGYANSSLNAGTNYYYVASAVNVAGESPNSSQVAAMTRPAAPVLNTPTVGDRLLGLSWSAVAGATTYRVKRATTSGGPYTTIATTTTTSYADSGLTNGVVYYYVVAAVNVAGEGPNSAQVSGKPVAPPPICSCPPGYTCKCGDNRCYSSTQQCP
jgi:fibronectin type 3 domain-containing protein